MKGVNFVALDSVFIVRPDDLRQLVHPFALQLFCDVLLNACEDDSICSLDGPVRLWVVQRGKAQLGA